MKHNAFKGNDQKMKNNLKILLDQIDEQKKVLDTFLPMRRDREQRLWDKFRLEWNYNSNHIEGNTLTYTETKLLLIFDKTTGNHEMREYEEMKAHDVAVELTRNWAEEERVLTESEIRQLNQIILVRDFWKDAITPGGDSTRRKISVGKYKSHPNSVRLPNGEMFYYTTPEEVPVAMAELIEWYRNIAPTLHPVSAAALLHYKFVLIHPFDDGNGRVSRLLMNFHLLKYGLPPVIIPSAGKKEYLDALNRADGGDMDFFVSYIAGLQLVSLSWKMKAAKGESLEEPGDFDKKLAILEKNLLKEEPSVYRSPETIATLIDSTVIPFTKDFVAQQNKVGVFFQETKVIFRIIFQNHLKEINGDPHDPDIFSELIESVADILKKEVIDSIEVKFQFRNFNKSKPTFSLSSSLNWFFGNENFGLGAPAAKIDHVYRGYAETVSPDDEALNGILEKTGMYILSEIEEKTSKN
ncbi:MAG: Fic family protein [Bacteroidia bacterium]